MEMTPKDRGTLMADLYDQYRSQGLNEDDAAVAAAAAFNNILAEGAKSDGDPEGLAA